MTKKQARDEAMASRKALSEGAYLSLNQQLYHQFFAHIDLSFTKVLHLFLSIEKKREPDTWMILDRIRREHPHVRLVVPRMKDDGMLEHFYYEGLHQLKTNAWGIAEPHQGVPAAVEKIDTVLVPLLAFDRQGNRVGYGKGFYDKFLATCRANTKKIGLSLFDPVEIIDEIDPWDVRLNQCVTPNGIVLF